MNDDDDDDDNNNNKRGSGLPGSTLKPMMTALRSSNCGCILTSVNSSCTRTQSRRQHKPHMSTQAGSHGAHTVVHTAPCIPPSTQQQVRAHSSERQQESGRDGVHKAIPGVKSAGWLNNRQNLPEMYWKKLRGPNCVSQSKLSTLSPTITMGVCRASLSAAVAAVAEPARDARGGRPWSPDPALAPAPAPAPAPAAAASCAAVPPVASSAPWASLRSAPSDIIQARYHGQTVPTTLLSIQHGNGGGRGGREPNPSRRQSRAPLAGTRTAHATDPR